MSFHKKKQTIIDMWRAQSWLNFFRRCPHPQHSKILFCWWTLCNSQVLFILFQSHFCVKFRYIPKPGSNICLCLASSWRWDERAICCWVWKSYHVTIIIIQNFKVTSFVYWLRNKPAFIWREKFHKTVLSDEKRIYFLVVPAKKSSVDMRKRLTFEEELQRVCKCW